MSKSQGGRPSPRAACVIFALVAGVVAPGVAVALEPNCPVAAPLPAAAPVPARNRVALFVSDLHMGVGRRPDGDWYAIEDFRWDHEFADFLHAAGAEGDRSADLVLVGDVFELWQSLDPSSCDHESNDLGCTRDEALARFARVRSQHRLFFESVGEFAAQRNNRVTILPGNHDVAILFPEVAAAVLSAFPKKARPRIRVASEGYWMSADGAVYAEHGQQIGADPNCFKKWPQGALIREDSVLHARKPWGEQFVQKLYNRQEADFATIDNLQEELLGAWYAIQARGLIGTLEEVGRLIRFVFTQTSWDQARQILGKDGVPVWKVDEELARLDTSEKRWRFLVESRPTGDPLRVPFEGVDFTTLPDQPPFSREEVEAICDRRWLLRKQHAGAGISECSSTGQLGAVAQKVEEFVNSKAKDEVFRKHLRATQAAIPPDARPDTLFSVFVYGHTHKEQKAYSPWVASDPWRPVVYNDGAWQRTASPEVWCTIARSKGLSDVEALRQLRPEDLPGCYPFVTVFRDEEGEPLVKQMYWVQEDSNHAGSVQPGCSAVPAILDQCL